MPKQWNCKLETSPVGTAPPVAFTKTFVVSQFATFRLLLLRLLYAAPACLVGLLSLVQDKARIERFIAKSARIGYSFPNNCDYEELE